MAAVRVLAALIAATALASVARFAPTVSVPPRGTIPAAGVTIEPSSVPLGQGFDFRCRSATSWINLTLDPLGSAHADSSFLASPAGVIALAARYSPSVRSITITARRGGIVLGECSWRVDLVLR